MARYFTKYNQEFKILLETEKNHIHFALIQAMWDSNNIELDDDLYLDKKSLGKKGGYYLLWGPEDDPRLEFHGISPLRMMNNNKMQFSKAMKTFFEVINNSDKQTFFFINKSKDSAMFYESGKN